MNALNLKLSTLALLVGTASLVSAADGDQGTTRNGEHPAVIQARLAAKAGYDYASKFYPHPARLELFAEAPRELGDHPAVIVTRNATRAAREAAQSLPTPSDDRLAKKAQ